MKTNMQAKPQKSRIKARDLSSSLQLLSKYKPPCFCFKAKFAQLQDIIATELITGLKELLLVRLSF